VKFVTIFYMTPLRKILVIVLTVLSLSTSIFCADTKPNSPVHKSLFPHDKLDHVIYSALIYKVLEDRNWKKEEVILTTLSIGILKELSDEYLGTTGFDLIDLGANGIGIVLGDLL